MALGTVGLSPHFTAVSCLGLQWRGRCPCIAPQSNWGSVAGELSLPCAAVGCLGLERGEALPMPCLSWAVQAWTLILGWGVLLQYQSVAEWQGEAAAGYRCPPTHQTLTQAGSFYYPSSCPPLELENVANPSSRYHHWGPIFCSPPMNTVSWHFLKCW